MSVGSSLGPSIKVASTHLWVDMKIIKICFMWLELGIARGKMKRSFFQAVVVLILLYGCTTWTHFFVYKIKIVMSSLTSSSTLNGPITVWLTIPVPIIPPMLPCCLLLHIGTSELNKTHLLTHPSGSSNVSRDSSVKITLEKSIFPVFLGPILTL